MALDLWFREDVARILASAAETMTATQAAAPALDPVRAEAYGRGFADAIRALAVAFGVGVPRFGDGREVPEGRWMIEHSGRQ